MTSPGSPVRLDGLVLAAGAGTRMGLPKALLTEGDVPRPLVAAQDLHAAGCEEVSVVLGARAEEAERLLRGAVRRSGSAVPWLSVVVAEDWAAGMGASLAAGLAALERGAARADAPDAALVTLVDLPDVTAAVMRRVVRSWEADGARSDALLRATYGGRPGHPVLLGRAHWPALTASLAGDTGGRTYLERHSVRTVSCDDLATGRDVDRPSELRDAGRPPG